MTFSQKVRLILGVSLVVFIVSQISLAGSHSITHTETTLDSTDFQALDFGQTGFYFPQFAASNPISGQATDDNMRFSVPSWLGFQFDPFVPAFATRTFSQDAGGVFSEGGDNSWDTFTLPALAGGEVGLSGSVVDPNTAANSNNTVNRIQLGAGVPASFLLRIVVDNTNQEHDPAGRLRARGDSDNGGVDVDVRLTGLTFNGITDIYTFRYDGFEAGDFIKIQLNSGVPGTFAGFGGLMFDVIPEPTSIALGLLGFAGLMGCRWRERSPCNTAKPFFRC